ncbi:MAG: peptidylprolyl isomerase [Pseudomonadota bacterium]
MYRTISCLLLTVCFAQHAASESDSVVARDGEATITRAELEAALTMSPSSYRTRAANDLDERLELINNMLQIRKLALLADSLPSDTPGYWETFFEVLAVKRTLALKYEKSRTKFPDPEALAQEYYATQKDKYALVPEQRLSSHILFASPPGLPRDELRIKANEILEELRAGADFAAYVKEYSADPGSKSNDGLFDKWMTYGDPDVTPPYSEALFKVDSIGQYSAVTDSQFGLHIIRLDGVRESRYLTYEEAKNRIYADIEQDFNALASREVAARYVITNDAFIDGAAMEEIFEPFKDGP